MASFLIRRWILLNKLDQVHTDTRKCYWENKIGHLSSHYADEESLTIFPYQLTHSSNLVKNISRNCPEFYNKDSCLRSSLSLSVAPKTKFCPVPGLRPHCLISIWRYVVYTASKTTISNNRQQLQDCQSHNQFVVIVSPLVISNYLSIVYLQHTQVEII